MSQFSLSPAVTVTEYNNSQYIQNLPSSKTGMVLRADYGPCNKIIPIANEGDLLYWFKKPTASNYQDWFQAWNFLQYARNLYVSRPMNLTVKNAGVKLTGVVNDPTMTPFNYGGLYNTEVAEVTLKNPDNEGDFSNDRLHFFNRFITSNQNVALSVCSSSTFWKSPIGMEFVGNLTPDATDITTINDFGGLSAVSGNYRLELTETPTLKAGSKFIAQGNKMFTVTNVYTSSVAVNAPIYPKDLALYVGTTASAGNSASTDIVADGIIFDGSSPFTLQRFAVVNFGVDQVYYVDSIVPIEGSSNKKVFFVGIPDHCSNGPIVNLSSAQTLYSNTDYFKLSLSLDYYQSETTINSASGFYYIPVGTTAIKVDPDFNFPVNSLLKFNKSGNVYDGLISDVFTPNEVGTDEDNYQIVAIDTLNNIITLDRGLSYKFNVEAQTVLLDDINVNIVSISGVNLHSTIYDESMIRKTKMSVFDTAQNKNVTIYKEALPAFDQFFDYQPNWVKDEFVTVVLVKNENDKYEFGEAKLASYNLTARGSDGKNLFADEVFYYSSKYVYCKVTDNDVLYKVNTATGGVVKFANDYGTVEDGEFVSYGTVYPLAGTIDDNGATTVTINALTGLPTYDPFNYHVADIQNAADGFSNAELFDINLLIAHELDLNYMSTIAESRKDCVALVGPYDHRPLVGRPLSEATSYLTERFGSQTAYDNKSFDTFGTYTGIFGNMKYQYDRYNDVNRWIAVLGDIAGLAAQTDNDRDPWWAFAGLNRGKVKNVIKLAFNPNKQNRDELYVNAINPIITIAGEGVGILFGQKTATAQASALDRINVRRMLITIEKALATAVKYSLFEFNDSFTRNRLVGMIDPFLRNVKARRGVFWYAVKCDATNNTPFVIDNNALVIDVAVQPTKVAEYINLNIFINRTGEITFGETIG